jgi:hypothetical protein
VQAVDILHPWTLDPSTGAELAPFTTFSIAMIHRQSRGQLPLFVAGLERFKALKVGGHGQQVGKGGGGECIDPRHPSQACLLHACNIQCWAAADGGSLASCHQSRLVVITR